MVAVRGFSDTQNSIKYVGWEDIMFSYSFIMLKNPMAAFFTFLFLHSKERLYNGKTDLFHTP